MKNKNLILSLLLLLLGLLAAIAPYSFAHVCELGEKVMKCHWTARAELFTGLGIALFALLSLFVKADGFALGLDLAIIFNGLGVILYPTLLIGVCGMKKMHCHSVTQPTLIVFGILILVIAAADFASRSFKKN